MVSVEWPIYHKRLVWEFDFCPFGARFLLQVTLVVVEVEIPTIWQHAENDTFSSFFTSPEKADGTQSAPFPAQ